MGNKIHVLDDNFRMWTRDERPGDSNVMGEVIKDDTYMLREIAAAIGNMDVILDVGGHIGSFSVLASRWWPEAKIFAIEPNSRSHELLALNFKDHIKNKDCKTYKGAMRYDNSNLLTDGASATGGGFMASSDWKATPAPGHEQYQVLETEVDLYTVKDILDDNDVDRIDLLKLDCECSEMEILRDMPDDEITRIGAICGEYHKGAESILELLGSRFPNHVSRAGSNHPEIGRFWCLPQDVAKDFPFPF